MSTATTKGRKAKAPTFATLPTTYAALVAMHPPRLIESKAAADEVAAVLTSMAGRELNADQIAYGKLLTHLLAEWQREHPRPGMKRLTPAELLAAMMEEHELSQEAMARRLGVSQTLVSLVLKGDRGMSKGFIRKFADEFNIDPARLL